MPRPNLLALCVLCACLTGCKSARESAIKPLPARSFSTQGGELLELSGNLLTIRSHPRDIESALGVGLEQIEGGVRVTNRVRASARLQPKDRIVFVAARLPRSSSRKAGKQQKQQAQKKPATRPTPASLRKRPGGHAVARIDDLRGYMAGVGWVRLDLVVRRDGKELVVSQKLRVQRRNVEYEEAQGAEADRLGYRACSMEDWPDAQRPSHAAAHPDALLVVRVETRSPAALAGLRPGDLIRRGPEADLDVDSEDEALTMEVYKPDGEVLRMTLKASDKLDIWLPLLFSYQRSGMGSHLGLGPFDWLFHWSSLEDYYAVTDRYHHTSRWSLLTLIQWQNSGRRSKRWRYYALNPLIDVPRMSYFVDWMEDRYR